MNEESLSNHAKGIFFSQVWKIVRQVPIKVNPNPHNERYLKTKQQKMGHLL